MWKSETKIVRQSYSQVV